MSVHGPPRLHFAPLKLLENFDFNADPDSALPSYTDPDSDSKINADPCRFGSRDTAKITLLSTCTKQRQMNGLTWCWGRRAGRSRCRSPHRTADGILGRSSPFFSLLWCSTFVNITSVSYCYCSCGSDFHRQCQKTMKNVTCGCDTAGNGGGFN